MKSGTMFAISAVSALALVGLLGWTPPGPHSLPKESAFRGKQLLLVGDSLAVGLQPRMKRLATEADASRFSSDAEQSTTIVQWSRGRFARDLATYSPDVVVIVLGTNDAAMMDVGPSEEAMKSILAQAAAKNVKVYWVGVPPMPPRLQNAEAVRNFLRKSGVTYLPEEGAVEGRARDGIHYTPGGYDAWASRIWSMMERHAMTGTVQAVPARVEVVRGSGG